MRIYTRTGDRGETGLFGGQRVPKTHARVASYGDIDELNSLLGVVRLHTAGLDPLETDLQALQGELFVLGADLATPPEKDSKTTRIADGHVAGLEAMIDRYQDAIPPQTRFVLPGGNPAGAHLHLARCVCRRAERTLIEAAAAEADGTFEACIRYVNRVSDLLYSMARFANTREDGGPGEVFWDPPPAT